MNVNNKKVIVVGGGAAGMLAAIFAARNKNQVILLEKNEKLGKKLYITGKGRCNLTNACDMDDLFQNVVTNPKFLYGAFYSYSNFDVINFFEEIGLKTKIERGNRVFPESDKSSDVLAVLLKELKQLGVDIRYNCEASEIILKDNSFCGVKIKNNPEMIHGDKVIIATGGLSYPATGSTGDGYRFAKEMGHSVTKLYPSLVPMNVAEVSTVKELQGLSLKNIHIRITSKNKEIYSDFGELLFTHFGVSGPVILSASSYCISYMENKDLVLSIDLKPALSKEQLDTRILRDFDEFSNKQYKNALDQLLPRKLIQVIIALSKIDPEKKVNLITKEERSRLVDLLKGMEFHITRLRDYNEAVITKGGIQVKEINPSTMESKLISGVYFAGEVLDLDALTGGFNLQIAWSTAYSAGSAV
ncbi:aminoacetone oxidase family FAD-binding enzyme [Anaerocolumna sedimenticola]|uniref:Aminoacetone oxidase family FAD-binding enzyme n=1 Tax=Anaerocolumna sedimenticola TaxID=2696063 RepID=A0A6P1TP27_9FIRM|nr:NAD(P)/FAD-dependent oxidoreductase [Anaerocolumna sedimenticola]QHQ62193.1 aminoacetone oxidase family FAD-binding enzyme [Anaerocolumna sedimenticola]